MPAQSEAFQVPGVSPHADPGSSVRGSFRSVVSDCTGVSYLIVQFTMKLQAGFAVEFVLMLV